MRFPSNLDYAPAFLLAAILVAFRLVTGVQETRSQKRIAPLLEASYAAYDSGRQPQANQALFELVGVLQRDGAEWAGTPYGRKLALELCLAYGRLGLLAGETAERSKDFALAKPWCEKSGEPAVADAAELRMTLAHVDDNEGSADESADEQAVHSRN
jgi:hypothetical protein